MTHDPRRHPDDTARAYRAAILRGAVSGTVRALIVWILEH